MQQRTLAFGPAPAQSGIELVIVAHDGFDVQLKARELGMQLVGADNTVSLGTRLVGSFVVKNVSDHPVRIQRLILGGRGPGATARGWNAPHVDWTAITDFTLQPGEQRSYSQEQRFDQPGDYFAEPSYLNAKGVWGGIPTPTGSFARRTFRVGSPVTPAGQACRAVPGANPNRPAPPPGRPALIAPYQDNGVKLSTDYGGYETHQDFKQPSGPDVYNQIYAVDLYLASKAGPQSFPVRAAASGWLRVYAAEDGVAFIDHGYGWKTAYRHMSQISVNGRTPRPTPDGHPEQGDQFWVNQGDAIGMSGDVGSPDGGIHLHFELRGGYTEGQSPRTWTNSYTYCVEDALTGLRRGASQQVFQQTGQAVPGRFVAAWQGGHSYDDSVYINGLPISPARDAVSPTDGKAYLTQWFERARLEWHPENEPPYDVQFGLLGAAAAQGRHDGPFAPVPNPGAGSMMRAFGRLAWPTGQMGSGLQWFRETQHTVGDLSEGGQAIARVWSSLGGIGQFGFPLSQPFPEQNRDNGQTYLVQYFERQRFEYHPESKGTRYEVLFGRIGAEQFPGSQPSVPPLPNPVPTPPGPSSRLVLAFFYPWFGPGIWDSQQMSDSPIQPYDSSDPADLERQVHEAQGAGVDGFISSWTGQDQETARNFPKLLEVAAKDNFKVTVYFEIDRIQTHGNLETQLKNIIDTYQGDGAFLHYNGKPVFFFWRADAYGDVSTWQQLRRRLDPNHTQIWSVDTTDAKWLDVFDSIHLFSAAKWNQNTSAADVANVDNYWRNTIDTYNLQHPDQPSRLWVAGAIPGWDESRDQAPGHDPSKVIPRRDGAVYQETWCAAIASRPEWIAVTSYNEWFEGSQIEPSQIYGTKYLDLTRKWSAQYKAGAVSCGP
jgi:murein DD-endopeptidase MepM/ murein hydrolase activator NlpD